MSNKKKYPPINCKNCGKSFIPEDARQVYCEPQCRIIYNNAKSKFMDKPFNVLKKAIKSNEKVLETAKRQLVKIGNDNVSMDVLIVAGYEPDAYFENTIDTETGKMIFWNIKHGIIPMSSDKPIFKILKR